MNTLHEMAAVALNSTSSAVERTLHTLEVNAKIEIPVIRIALAV